MVIEKTANFEVIFEQFVEKKWKKSNQEEIKNHLTVILYKIIIIYYYILYYEV